MKETISTKLKSRKFSDSSANDLSPLCKMKLNLVETIDKFAYWKSAYSVSDKMII